MESIASCLGMQQVGWLFAHPPREKGFFFSSLEVITAAELQLEAAKGVAETSFVTVKVTLNEEGAVIVEGFQVSQQCMEMVAESVLDVGPNPGSCAVNPTFTAIMEGKESKEVRSNCPLRT